MSEKLAKPSVAIVQSFLVILLTYLLSAVRETEIVSTTLSFISVIMDGISLKGDI